MNQYCKNKAKRPEIRTGDPLAPFLQLQIVNACTLGPSAASALGHHFIGY